MSTNLERLLTIQDRDRAIARLQRELRDIPERKKQLQARLQAHHDFIRKAQEELKKTQAEIKKIEGEVEAARQKIAKFREQQYQIKSNTEYRALEHEISVVEKQIRDLEDRELVLMEQAEQYRAAVASREQDLKKEESRVTEEQQAFDRRLDEVRLEIRKLETDRGSLAEQMDGEWLARYERIYRRVGDFALVPIEHSACGGCHMNLPPHLIHEAHKGLTLVQCTYCSRILYWRP